MFVNDVLLKDDGFVEEFNRDARLYKNFLLASPKRRYLKLLGPTSSSGGAGSGGNTNKARAVFDIKAYLGFNFDAEGASLALSVEDGANAKDVNLNIHIERFESTSSACVLKGEMFKKLLRHKSSYEAFLPLIKAKPQVFDQLMS